MGWSERPTAPRRMADRIEDLNRLTEALEITGPVVVVAHDWGGPIALGWALGHLDQLAGVVLTNTGVALPERRTGRSSAPGLIRLARSAALRQTVCVSTPAFVRGTTALSRPALPDDVRAALASPYGTADRRRSIGDFVADIPLEPDHPSRVALDRVAGGLAELREVPSLLLWGPGDPVFSDALPERSVPAAAPRLHPAVPAGLAPGHRGRSGNGRARVALGRGSAGGSTSRRIPPATHPTRNRSGLRRSTTPPNPSGPALSARAGDRAVAAVEISAQGDAGHLVRRTRAAGGRPGRRSGRGRRPTGASGWPCSSGRDST